MSYVSDMGAFNSLPGRPGYGSAPDDKGLAQQGPFFSRADSGAHLSRKNNWALCASCVIKLLICLQAGPGLDAAELVRWTPTAEGPSPLHTHRSAARIIETDERVVIHLTFPGDGGSHVLLPWSNWKIGDRTPPTASVSHLSLTFRPGALGGERQILVGLIGVAGERDPENMVPLRNYSVLDPKERITIRIPLSDFAPDDNLSLILGDPLIAVEFAHDDRSWRPATMILEELTLIGPDRSSESSGTDGP